MRLIAVFFILFGFTVQSQVLNSKTVFNRQDSLRGSNTEYRNWWDVQHYDITLEPDFSRKSIKGTTKMRFKIVADSPKQQLQIDLQQPMQLDEVLLDNKKVKKWERDGQVYFLEFDQKLVLNKEYELEMKFSGNPRLAVRPPWDGGWIFTRDDLGRPWMTMSCQGLGASVWFPNKDYQGDEPDQGAKVTLVTPKEMVGVSNGRLIKKIEKGDKTEFVWEVKNPINNYNIAPYIGYYTEIKDQFSGEKGNLDLAYWILDYNVEKAKAQFVQSKSMLKAFEHWFGPYPFYEDSYKLVEAPHLGMEHQSGVAYGNFFTNGYLGSDLSGTGWGMKWDFIIIHESGHEWFGNNITTDEVADMWVHESFTAYSESLYTEFLFGKEAGSDYVIGTRRSILNDVPMIGFYGVNKEGSSDIYYKGANVIHTFRQWLNDDEKFRMILRKMNEQYYHQTVTSAEIENFLAQESGLDLTAFFNQYLRTTQVPVLEYKIEGNQISYRWNKVESGFALPLKLTNSEKWIQPTTAWKTEEMNTDEINQFGIDRNFYIYVRKIN